MRRSVLVGVGVVAVVLAGVASTQLLDGSGDAVPAAASSGPASSGALRPATTPRAANGVRTRAPGFGRSLAQSGTVTVPRERAAAALCEVVPASVKGLAGIARQPAPENLRDGIPLLAERVDELRLAAEGRPALAPVVTRLDRVLALWRQAVAATDAGHAATSSADVASAQKLLGGLDADLKAAYPGYGADCAG